MSERPSSPCLGQRCEDDLGRQWVYDGQGWLQDVTLGAAALTPLEETMAAAILFMPELGHLTAGVTRDVIARCVRVAIQFGASAALPGSQSGPRSGTAAADSQGRAGASPGTYYLQVNPIQELLKAGRIVGLDPREMTANALEVLMEDQETFEQHRAAEYAICKGRGHTDSGVILPSNPPWNVCKHCGTWWRIEAKVVEENVPGEAARD